MGSGLKMAPSRALASWGPRTVIYVILTLPPSQTGTHAKEGQAETQKGWHHQGRQSRHLICP